VNNQDNGATVVVLTWSLAVCQRKAVCRDGNFKGWRCTPG